MEIPQVHTREALLAEGWSERAIAKAVSEGSWERVRRGQFAIAGPRDARVSHSVRVLAAWRARSGDYVISHHSAAVLHGLPVRTEALGEVHLTRWSSTHGKTVAGVRVHRAAVRADDVVMKEGVPVTTLERTLADVCRLEPFAWGVVVADAALRAGARADAVAALVDQGERRRGNGRLRQVLAFADGRAESPAESLSRVSIERAGLPAPLVQFEVHRPDGGGWVATSDFGWPAFGVVGEMDGRLKYRDSSRRAGADAVMGEKQRDALIVACGFTPAHWGWSMATRPAELGAYLRGVFASRGHRV